MSEAMTIRQPKRFAWEPREDITTLELALAVGALFVFNSGNTIYAEDYLATQPEGVRRHFREM